MIVYHGSTLEVKSPDADHSKKYLDFGSGFYVTSYKTQAEKWACRKGMRSDKPALVSVYDFDENASDIIIKRFMDENSDWLDYVCECRRGNDVEIADIIIGAVADDDVFKTVDMFVRGLWDRERTIEELRYYKKNNQIAIKNKKAIDKTLHFLYSYEVK